MTDKSDDIKQLFSHLGLDHNVYQEMRTASRPSVTITETPRRWSLLQSVAQPPAVTPIAPPPAGGPAPVPAAPVSALAVPPPVAADLAPPTAPRAPVALASGLASPAAGVHRGEPATPLWPATGTSGTPQAPTHSRMSADESLRLLFQAVREPGPATGTGSPQGYDDVPVVPPSSVVDTPMAAVPPPSPPAMPGPAPTPPPAPMVAGTDPAPATGGSLNALFDRLRGAPAATEPAPGRLRLNVPKAP